MGGWRSCGCSPRANRPWTQRPGATGRAHGPASTSVSDGAAPRPGRGARGSAAAPPRRSPRALALVALERVDGGAYANLVVPALLAKSPLPRADRNLVTELVYGTTRMRRACDWLVDRFLVKPPDRAARAALRLGAYQLQYLRVPAHAAVGETVAAAPAHARPLVNAVLRRLASCGHPAAGEWPSDAVRLSYPDWIVDTLVRDLGPERGLAALEAMNQPADVTVRADGYIQDRASQWVADALAPQPPTTVLDL